MPPELTGASGPFRFAPAALAVPEGRADVRGLLDWAAREGLAIVPRGAGTGMPGHNVGPGVLVIPGPGLRSVGEVDTDSRTVRVGPGAVASDVAAAAAAAGLYFPPLPSSADRCTLGGMVANNAAGARSFGHGAVRDWVLELEVELAVGDSVTLGPGRPSSPALTRAARSARTALGTSPPAAPDVRKNASGYALDRFLPAGDGAQLLVGSEGTLGVVTSILLRLIPAPERRAVVLCGLPDLEALPGMAEEAERLGVVACEYLGRRLLDLARLEEDEEVGPLARAAEALVLLELEGPSDAVEEGVQRVVGRIGGSRVPHLVARSDAARERLWHLRHRASPTIAAAADRGLRSLQFIEDCVVPRPALPDFVRGLGRILAAVDTDAVVFGHAGDGNLHVNPLVDTTREAWRDRVRAILGDTVDLVAGLGGTLSGEHGDGRVRAPYVERIWGPAWTSAFRSVKETLDPRGILNPGVVLPLPGQDPLEGLLDDPVWGGAP